MQKITPFLWFNHEAEEAFEFYATVFASAKKLGELRSSSAGPGPEGSLIVMDLEIEGQQMTFLNGGPAYPFSPAFSLVVRCQTQAEIDSYWEKLLADGGKTSQCGWLVDRFGLSWQVVPHNIAELVRKPAAMTAMMAMVKLDIATLVEAGAKG